MTPRLEAMRIPRTASAAVPLQGEEGLRGKGPRLLSAQTCQEPRTLNQ